MCSVVHRAELLVSMSLSWGVPTSHFRQIAQTEIIQQVNSNVAINGNVNVTYVFTNHNDMLTDNEHVK